MLNTSLYIDREEELTIFIILRQYADFLIIQGKWLLPIGFRA